MSNLGAVRHVGFDPKWIFIILPHLRIHIEERFVAVKIVNDGDSGHCAMMMMMMIVIVFMMIALVLIVLIMCYNYFTLIKLRPDSFLIK